MRVPLSWLREFTDCALSPDDLARRLTLGGLEVEAIDRIGVFSEEVRVARIRTVRSHPDADRLQVVELDFGDGLHHIAVTGAPNVQTSSEGSLVAAALSPAILVRGDSDTFELATVQARVFRGIESDAVLCSEKELGLSSDHSGVLFLPDAGAAPGDPVSDHRPPPPDAPADVVLDVAILPNYGRCLSIIGMAREVAALTRSSFRLRLDAVHLPPDPKSLEIEIEAPDLCPRYTGAVLRGVEVRPSPWWMQRRLVLTGHKPINCLVDVTNYVMIEIGEPMHAFDLDQLPAPSIRVRRARPGETIATLDQKEATEEGGASVGAAPRALDSDVLLITSGGEPVAVAGVIGGLHSQIHAETRNVLLEAANFDSIAVRKAAALLKVNTESSYRFSRDVDPNLTAIAIQRAAFLLREVAGADPEGGALSDRYPGKRPIQELHVRIERVCRTLGMELSADEVGAALERLGFTVEATTDPEILHVEIPGFRRDVANEADVAEEVIRVIGFDRLTPRALAEPLPRQRRNYRWELRRSIREFLVGTGLQEVSTYSFTSPNVERRLELSARGETEAEGGSAASADGPWLAILNPSSQERSVLRRTLLAGLLETVARNHRERDRIAIFEVGLVWRPEAGDDVLPAELLQLAIALSGPVDEPSWADPTPREYGFFELKGLLEGLLARFPLGGGTFERHRTAPWHPGIAARLVIGADVAATLGEIHPHVLRSFDIEGRRVVGAVLDLEQWIDAAGTRRDYKPLGRFPVLRQDLSLVVSRDLPSRDVEIALRETAGPLLLGVRLVDLYRGPQIGPDEKSLSFRLEFGAADRSLTEEEVNAIRDRILPELAARIGAKIR